MTFIIVLLLCIYSAVQSNSDFEGNNMMSIEPLNAVILNTPVFC